MRGAGCSLELSSCLGVFELLFAKVVRALVTRFLAIRHPDGTQPANDIVSVLAPSEIEESRIENAIEQWRSFHAPRNILEPVRKLRVGIGCVDVHGILPGISQVDGHPDLVRARGGEQPS